MDTITLDAQPRETGKKAAKAVRNSGQVPCVLYGTHIDPVHFSVEALTLRPLIHTSDTYRIAVTLDGADHEAILKEVAFHPVTDAPIHADFLALTKGEALTMTVPVLLEGTPAGVRAGGSMAQPLHEIEVRCLPKDIPGHVAIDVSALEVGESLHVSDLGLGEAVEVLTDPERTIVTVTAPRAAVEETETAGGVLGEAPEGADEAESDDEA